MRTRLVLFCLALCACLPRPPEYSAETGLAGTLELEPSGPVDFDQMAVGCERSEDVYAINQGDKTLAIEQVELDVVAAGLAWAAGDSSPLPWRLQPSERKLLGELLYAPMGLPPGDELGTLRVWSSDPAMEKTVLDVQGSVGGGRERDSFVAGAHPVDIVITVERSGSTMDEVSAVSAKLGSFVEALAAAGVSYRILAVTEIDGCHSAGEAWIDNQHSAQEAVVLFEAMVANTPSAELATQGLLRAENALSAQAQGAGGCNEGFRRDEAMLHIIGISDAPDTSPSAPKDYVQTQKAAMKWPFEVVYHGIGAEVDCGDARAYDGFLDAASMTRGHWISLCDGVWWSQVEGLATGLLERADRSAYPLTRPPISATISVEVDSEVLAEGDWIYNEEANAVLLEDEVVPGTGISVDIGYYPEPVCD